MTDGERVGRLMGEYDQSVELYERFGANVEHLLRDLLGTTDIKFNAVTSRLKKRDSFERKIKSNPKYVSIETVTDVTGARVTTNWEEDVDRVADIIRNEFDIDVRNSVDKRRILQTDRFGYQSLHLVASLNDGRASLRENRIFAGLKVEIQVRSLLQHAWAEMEHGLGYKGESAVPASIRRRFYRLAGLLELADQEFVAVRREALELTQDLPICRTEGLAEVVPDFSIEFPYSALPEVSDFNNQMLVLSLNTCVANRLVDVGGLTEVEMYVENGVSRSTVNKGRAFSASSIAFLDVFPIGAPVKGEVIRLRFSGVRVNAFMLGATSTGAPTTIQAQVAIAWKDRSREATPLAAPVDIARVKLGASFEVFDPSHPSVFPVKVQRSELPTEVMLRVVCRPLFGDALRPGPKERSGGELSPIQGTRLLLRFHPIPAGVTLLVSVREIAEANTIACFQLAETDVNGNGRFSPVKGSTSRTIDGLDVDFAEVHVSGQTAFAVWECTNSMRPDAVASFALIVSIPVDIKMYTMNVNCSMAPLSNVGVLSSQDPIPRFADTSEPIMLFEPI